MTGRATFDDRVCEIVHGVRPLDLRKNIAQILEERLIEDRGDLNAFAECMFDIILKTKSDDSQLGEIIAEMLVLLRQEMPLFCSCGRKLPQGFRCCLVAGENAVTFTRILINCVQSRFESLIEKFATEERLGAITKDREAELAACVTFIGRLYVRKLVAARVVAQVVAETIGVSERQPHASCIHCVCELMRLIGHFMEDSKPGEALMGQFITRLNNLAELTDATTNRPIYEQEIRHCLGDLQRERSLKWPTGPVPAPVADDRPSDTEVEGTAKVLLRYIVVDWLEAERIWNQLRQCKALPPAEMLLDGPPGDANVGQHITISSLLSGRPVAVAFSQDLALLTAEVPKFAELISEFTGIYWRRIQIFDPDAAPLVE